MLSSKDVTVTVVRLLVQSPKSSHQLIDLVAARIPDRVPYGVVKGYVLQSLEQLASRGLIDLGDDLLELKNG